MEMHDWRGNYYPEEKLGTPCEICGKPAVRNCCVAEGENMRTHWHGAIHTIENGLMGLCRDCANKENIKWIKLRGFPHD